MEPALFEFSYDRDHAEPSGKITAEPLVKISTAPPLGLQIGVQETVDGCSLGLNRDRAFTGYNPQPT